MGSRAATDNPGDRTAARHENSYCLRRFTSETANRLESAKVQLSATHTPNGVEMPDGGYRFPGMDHGMMNRLSLLITLGQPISLLPLQRLPQTRHASRPALEKELVQRI